MAPPPNLMTAPGMMWPSAAWRPSSWLPGTPSVRLTFDFLVFICEMMVYSFARPEWLALHCIVINCKQRSRGSSCYIFLTLLLFRCFLLAWIFACLGAFWIIQDDFSIFLTCNIQLSLHFRCMDGLLQVHLNWLRFVNLQSRPQLCFTLLLCVATVLHTKLVVFWQNLLVGE